MVRHRASGVHQNHSARCLMEYALPGGVTDGIVEYWDPISHPLSDRKYLPYYATKRKLANLYNPFNLSSVDFGIFLVSL